MKKLFLLTLVFYVGSTFNSMGQGNNVGIGTTNPDTSAALDVTSASKGMLVPRLHTTQRTNIAAPAQGLLVYDVDFNCFFYYNNSQWISLCQLSGPVGPTGPAGQPGVAGVAGATGPQGPAGANGLNGTNGTNGVNGLTGPQGPQGPAGANGAPGPSGADRVTGPTGPQGLQGNPGVNASTGSQGPTGADRATGPTGPSGANGTPGPTGPQGIQGIQGIQGNQGVQGVAGNNGTPGATGPTGAGSSLNIISASLTTDLNLTAAAFTNLPGLTLTFTPTKTQTFIEFTASGEGDPGGAGLAYFRILVNGTVVGGASTQATITNNYDGFELYGWDVAFSKLVTVNANASNTVVVQYYSADILLGGNDIKINASSSSSYEHGSLTAFVQ